MKVTCPNCGLEQTKKDSFCSRCGAKLAQDGDGVPTRGFASAVKTGRLKGVAQLPARRLVGSLLNLHLLRTGEILLIGGIGEYIIGRVSKGQSVLPDVDLEPYQAYKSGVSRLHARIKVESQSMWITDLGSANGTRVNDQKLTPHQEFPLSNKDVVRLGRMNIQALVGQD
ncbi:MAG TPA: FHA domain-containing protein [Anaerolineales bacterium]|nr:FHA domain-containing protein [Anaerolineales bacterium]